MPRKLRIHRTFFYLLLNGLGLLLFSCGTSKSKNHLPNLEQYDSIRPIVHKNSANSFSANDNFLQKNKEGLWELYLEGDPLQIGLNAGALTDSLLKKQENIFFSKVEDIVPSKFKQKMLRNFLKWYNRKIYQNVPNEYQAEIYGISKYSSHDFDNIAAPFQRSLYLHGAHDIGHALQDLAMVGCTSFAVWNEKSENGDLLLGRNFDFYVNDAFAEDKMVAFIKPKSGYPFMMLTWAGMIGAVSGMNKEGLSVTINASKSKIPVVAKTPISILTREILQYASTIEEAITIAKKRTVFVSESIMVGSAKDNKAVLIEITPKTMAVYEVSNSDELLCSNHFQSDALKNDNRNQAQIKNSHSEYRYERLSELLDETPKLNPTLAAAILRNRDGLHDLKLGYGNEKAINQLLAHHGIIFQPKQKLVWVSANPYQLGEFVCYDLEAIFSETPSPSTTLAQSNLNIQKDPFVDSAVFREYQEFRVEDAKMDNFLKEEAALTSDWIKKYQSLNPDYWVVYYKVGLYFYNRKEYATAKSNFERALTKEITTLPEKETVENYLEKSKRKTNDS